MPNLNTEIMSAIPMLVPPLPEQRAIAGVLGALDTPGACACACVSEDSHLERWRCMGEG
jgi:hypothetical protein